MAVSLPIITQFLDETKKPTSTSFSPSPRALRLMYFRSLIRERQINEKKNCQCFSPRTFSHFFHYTLKIQTLAP